jgi:DnaK suppressor protein
MAQKKSSKTVEKKSPAAPKKKVSAPAKGMKPAAKKPVAKPVPAKKAAAAKAPAKPVAAKKAAPKVVSKPVAKKPAPKPVAAKPPAKAPAPKSAPVPSGPISVKDLAHFRKLLVAKRTELLDDLMKNNEANLENSDEGIQDIADKATSSYTREFLYSLSEGDRRQLQLIEDALYRMENGSFGICVACNGLVNRPRLEAVPWARHCISCQELQERGLL